MPSGCMVPGCDNFRKKRQEGLSISYHRLPTDVDRCKEWLLAVKNPKYDEKSPSSLLGNLRVCSLHFAAEDYERDMQAEMMGGVVKKLLKKTAVPSLVGGGGPRGKRDRIKTDEETACSVTSNIAATVSLPSYGGKTQPVSASAKSDRWLVREATERTEVDVASVEVSLEMDTQPFKKNKGVMTRPRVTEFGPNCDIVPKASDLYVDRDCLLQLFQVCGMCSFGTGARIQEETGRFCVIQDCKICGHQKKWWSQSAAVETEGKETTEEGKQVRKSGGDHHTEELEDVCTLIMEFTSELFEYNVTSEEGDQTPSDEEEEEEDMCSDDDKALKESSDEWCPSDEEKELLLDSGSSENSECDVPSVKTDESWADGKLVEWCVDCTEESKLTCTTQRHKKLYACEMCVQEEAVGFDRFYMRFDDVAGFLEHVKGEHDFRPRLPLCTECGVLSYKNHLCEHKTKKYTCLDCGKRCISKHGLLVHRVSHRQARTYPCKFCLGPFQTKLDKHNHEKTHVADKRPYQCSECPETFSNIQKRNSHLRTHGNLKRHICLTCLKEFAAANHLQRHVRVHTGEKPFVCEVCQRSFNQQSHLNSHMRLHTGERPFVCSRCGKGFNHNVSLKNHLQRYHKPISAEDEKEECQEPNSVIEPVGQQGSGGERQHNSDTNYQD